MMALPREVDVSRTFKDLARPTRRNRPIESISAFPAMSNRRRSSKTKTAAQAGPLNGGELHAKTGPVFKDGFYSNVPRDAISRLYPFVAGRAHYIIESVGSRFRLTVRGLTGEDVRFLDTAGQANCARQALSDAGMVGIVWGGL